MDNISITNPGLYRIGKSDFSSAHFTQEKEDIIHQVSCGAGHSIIVYKSGRVFALGRNEDSQLGLDNDPRSFVVKPTPVKALSSVNVTQVACGDNHSLFLSSSGEVYSCGSNSYGQLGFDEKIITRKYPTKVTGIPPIKIVAAGGSNSVLVASSGELLMTGQIYNKYSNPQSMSNSHSKRKTFTISSSVVATITSVSCGGSHIALVTSFGALGTLGGNESGQLGLGHTTKLYTLEPVTLPLSVTSVACGASHTVALSTEGTVWAWGSNNCGQLGIGTNVDSTTPVKMVGLDNYVITKVVASSKTTALITEEGELLMCGMMRDGQSQVMVMTKVNQPSHLVVDQVAIFKDYILMLINLKPKSKPTLKPHSDISPWERVMLETLECPVCYNVMCAPIHLCTAGHSVCSSCRSHTTQCPTCRGPYNATRNFVLETLLEKVELPCSHCLKRLPARLLEEHSAVCPVRSYHCVVVASCGFSGSREAMSGHVTSVHSDRVWSKLPQSFSPGDTATTHALAAHNQVFLLHYRYDAAETTFRAAVSLVGPPGDSPQFRYKLTFKTAYGLRSQNLLDTVCCDTLAVQDMMHNEEFLIPLTPLLCTKPLTCEVDILKD